MEELERLAQVRDKAKRLFLLLCLRRTEREWALDPGLSQEDVNLMDKLYWLDKDE